MFANLCYNDLTCHLARSTHNGWSPCCKVYIQCKHLTPEKNQPTLTHKNVESNTEAITSQEYFESQFNIILLDYGCSASQASWDWNLGLILLLNNFQGLLGLFNWLKFASQVWVVAEP